MENQDLREVKREFNKEIDGLKREYKSFKRRVCSIANLFIPGIGFFIYGSSYLTGFISFALFSGYNLIFFKWIFYDTDFTFRVIYYIPAIIIWFISTVMVANLDD